jgi:hypothetical protein
MESLLTGGMGLFTRTVQQFKRPLNWQVPVFAFFAFFAVKFQPLNLG